MADTSPQPKEPKTGDEKFGDQNLQYAGLVGLGAWGYGGDSFQFMGDEYGAGEGFGFGGSSGWGGSNFGTWGRRGLLQPIEALVGTGTLEGKNKYDNFFTPGGFLANGMLPGARLYPGTYLNYRIMSAHSTNVIAAMALMGPVLAANWSIEMDDNAPSDAEDLIERYILNNRVKLVLEHLKALFYGYASFEKVWKAENGYLGYSDIRPLLPDLTRVWHDRGKFTGLQQNEISIGLPYCHIFTYDREGDNFYGRPMLENNRRPWSNQLNVEDNLERIGVKQASIIPIIKHPPGQTPTKDQNGKQVVYSDIAQQMGHALQRGSGVFMENLAVASTVEAMMTIGKRAHESLWCIDTLDLGDQGPVVVALIQLMEYLDKKMVRGWKVPERVILEARHGGGKADAGEMTDIHLMGCQFLHNQITSCINGQSWDSSAPPGLVDDLLLYNYGPKAVGTVRVVAEPLVDEQKATDDKILDASLNDPIILHEFWKRADFGAFMDRIGFARITKQTKPEDKIDPSVFEQPDPGDKPAQNNGNSNGNGAGNNRTALNV